MKWVGPQAGAFSFTKTIYHPTLGGATNLTLNTVAAIRMYAGNSVEEKYSQSVLARNICALLHICSK